MNSIIFVLCLVLAAGNGQIKDLAIYELNGERSEDYIKMNRKQQADALKEFDDTMNNFRQLHTGSAENLRVQRNMATASILQMEKHLGPLELLGSTSNKCVVKYRSTLPTVFNTETAINNCINQAINAIPALLTDAINSRNTMQKYFSDYFEVETIKCGKKFPKPSGNHTGCITTVIGNTNANIAIYQKTFANLMDIAECSATANVKKSSECCGTIYTQTTEKIAEINVLVNNCLLGNDDCKPCPAVCPQRRDFQVDYKNETILNPLFGYESHEKCLLLNLQN